MVNFPKIYKKMNFRRLQYINMKSRMMSEYGDSSARAQVEQKQMQDKLRQVQIEMQKKAEEIESMEFSSTDGSGAIEVIAKGDKTLGSIKIKDDSLLSTENKEKLEDLIVVAANKAFDKVDKLTDAEFAKITKGLPISGLK